MSCEITGQAEVLEFQDPVDPWKTVVRWKRADPVIHVHKGMLDDVTGQARFSKKYEIFEECPDNDYNLHARLLNGV